MIRSMSAALSGLRNHQLMLDVVGNDIANVSTTGFKSSTVVFSDVLTQNLRGGGAPTAQSGGTNPAQIGLGSRVTGTVQSFAQGAIQLTGRTTDIAIQGDGFFIVDNGGSTMYTRSGAFSLDANGALTTQDGMLVQGWQADSSGVVDVNQPLSPVQIRVGDLLSPVQTTSASLGGNLSADAAIGDVRTLTLNGYDTQGVSVPINMVFTKSAANQWTATASYGNPATAVALTDAVLTFDGNGELTAPADHNINIAAGLIPGMTGAISFDLGDQTAPGRVTQYSGSGSLGVSDQNGAGAGALQSFTVSQDGVIIGNYSNGRVKPIGQIALALFSNPAGLERVGGVWVESPNSGLAQVGTANAGGRGIMSAGTLEMSNVDLAEEFTRLIVAQRGFQGNARVITTSDEVLQEVVNLKR